MRRQVVLLGLVLGLSACNEYHYRFRPAKQPLATPMYADYRVREDRVEILIDTHGRRLLAVGIVGADGREVPAGKIDYPVFKPDLIGGMSGNEDPRYGQDIAQGPTVARFSKGAVGEMPWRVRMEVEGVGRVEVMVGSGQMVNPGT